MMIIVVGRISGAATEAIQKAGGRTQLIPDTALLMVTLKDAKIPSYGGTGDIQAAYILLSTGETLRYTRTWDVETCSLALGPTQG